MPGLKHISTEGWISHNAAQAAKHGKAYVLLCSECGGSLRRGYVPASRPEYVRQGHMVFALQANGDYWHVRDYPAGELPEVTNHA